MKFTQKVLQGNESWHSVCIYIISFRYIYDINVGWKLIRHSLKNFADSISFKSEVNAIFFIPLKKHFEELPR
jgi:hypothetical protein